jgi:hypothetical protein
LGFTEIHFAFLDIALKLITSDPNNNNWLLIFDIPFFQRLNKKDKTKVFNKLIELNNFQTLFCLHSADDVAYSGEVDHLFRTKSTTHSG